MSGHDPLANIEAKATLRKKAGDRPCFEFHGEAVRRIKREECARSGHLFDIILVRGKPDPCTLICKLCERSWSIGKGAELV